MSAGRVSKYDVPSTSSIKQIEWRCGLYLRLSREDGDKMESDSIANQRGIIDRFLAKNPELYLYDVYIDDGYTGTNFDRPDVQRLLEDIKSRKVNCLIVKDLSRYGRDHIEMGRYLEVLFPLLKLRVISVTENIDSYKNPESLKNVAVSFKVIINDEYCRDISNKVKKSLDMKRKKGEFIGSFASYGYLKDPDDRHKLIIDPEAAEVVRQIYEWFLEGVSLYNICRLLLQMGIPNPTEYRIKKGLKVLVKQLDSTKGAWSRRTVQRMLQNRMYTGDMIQKRMEKVSHKVQKCRQVPSDKHIIKENTHEPIIDKETFNKVQRLFLRDTWQPKSGDVNEDIKINNILSGFVKCSDCGRAMTRNKVTTPNGEEYWYFTCTSYRSWRTCTKHTIQVKYIEQAVIAILQKHIEMAVEFESLIDVINKSPVRNNARTRLQKIIETKESERLKFRKLLNDLYPDFKNELITKEQYLLFKAENEAKIAETDILLKTLNEQFIKEEQGVDGFNDYISKFKRYRNITALTREVLVELVNMIYVEDGGGIRIEFNFQDEYERALEYIEGNKALFQDDISTKSLIG